MIELIELSCINTVILIIWFKTEAWYEYTKTLGFGFLSKAIEYDFEKENDISMTYMKFLRKRYYHRFGIRLITCPICVSTWIAIFISLHEQNISLFPEVMIFGLILYGTVSRLLDI